MFPFVPLLGDCLYSGTPKYTFGVRRHWLTVFWYSYFAKSRLGGVERPKLKIEKMSDPYTNTFLGLEGLGLKNLNSVIKKKVHENLLK